MRRDSGRPAGTARARPSLAAAGVSTASLKLASSRGDFAVCLSGRGQGVPVAPSVSPLRLTALGAQPEERSGVASTRAALSSSLCWELPELVFLPRCPVYASGAVRQSCSLFSPLKQKEYFMKIGVFCLVLCLKCITHNRMIFLQNVCYGC